MCPVPEDGREGKMTEEKEDGDIIRLKDNEFETTHLHRDNDFSEADTWPEDSEED